jgi:protein-S-isoprenylcysteine O-methyltransferase Ste14
MGEGIGKSGYRYVIQRMTLLLVFAVILFVAAGTLHWLRGWIWLVFTLFMETGTLIILAKRAPETLRQRGARQVGVKTFDIAFAVCWLSLAFITPVVAGLDKRFEWSLMPMAALYGGIVLMAFVWPLATWAMVENEYFEQLVRIQTDRAQQVVTSGPYRVVRHPGYAGAIVGTLCTPLILGTWYTFIPAGAVALLFTIRTALEDRTLRKELEGYEAYTQQTRYRLLPGVW